MSIAELAGRLPAYAKDVRLNLTSLPTTAGLTAQQLWGTVLASAIATREPQVIRAAAAEAATRLTPAAIDAAKAAAAIMAMNNVYYRFTHLVGSKDYMAMPARLRMTVIGNPQVDRLDFELWSLAVSAINGCGACMEAHERELLAKGASRDMVQNAARIAAIINSVAVALGAEEAMAQGLRPAA